MASSPPSTTHSVECVSLDDGNTTTMHIVRLPVAQFATQIIIFDEPIRLVEWCKSNQCEHAITGGFFDRHARRPLGEIRLAGKAIPTTDFAVPAPNGHGTLHVSKGLPSIGSRDSFEANPDGELIQAGPLLLKGGAIAVAKDDPEGFATNKDQFDVDITAGRYQRCAIGRADDELILLAAEGAGSHPDYPGQHDSSGLTLRELASAMKDAGATDALNLDGGGSSSLIYQGQLMNQPIAGAHDPEGPGNIMPTGRPIFSAIYFSSK